MSFPANNAVTGLNSCAGWIGKGRRDARTARARNSTRKFRGFKEPAAAVKAEELAVRDVPAKAVLPATKF